MSGCGCGTCRECRGLQTSTPSRTTLEPLLPGGRRIARWADARASMRAGLSGQVIDGGPGIPGLRATTDDDPVIALTDAAAVVVDVLDFYSDRLGRESVLGTAAQADSIDYLGRAVGYRASPGVAAETVIAFDVEAIARTGEVPPSVIPIGTRIMNAPGPGERSVTFETVEPLVARPRWNTLTVSRWGLGRALSGAGTSGSVRIRGTSIPVILGDVLLVETADGAASWAGFLATVTGIQSIPEQQVTVLSWAEHADIVAPAAGVALQRVSLLGPSASAFVREPQQWSSIAVESGRTRAGVGSRVMTSWATVTKAVAADGTTTTTTSTARAVLTVTGRADYVWANPSPNPTSWVPLTRLSTQGNGSASLPADYLSIRDVLQELPLAAVPLGYIATPGDTIDVDEQVDLDAEVRLPLPRRIVLRMGEGAVDAIVDEVTTNDAFTPDGTTITGTRFLLREALDSGYDPATATVRANVAAATHGESKSVILGSGDASLAGQGFPLREVPIAWIREPDGLRSTLTVRVNGVAWHERPSFWGATASDRVFVVETAVDGATRILFGDWVAGSGLPDGNNNVVAALRIGADPAEGPPFSPGNMRSGALTTLVDRPLGVVSCVNHVPAVGGVDPPTPAERRTRIPIGLRAFRRAVAPLDYVDLALAEAGVAKARVDVLGGPRDRRIAVTVAGVGSAPGEIGAFPELKDLEDVLRAAGDPLVPLRVVSYQARDVTITGKLWIDADQDPATAVADADRVLQRRFAPARLELGADLHASEIVEALHGVARVAWLNLELPDIATSSSSNVVLGDPAEALGGGLVAGATLIVGVTVELEAAPAEDLAPERRWW